MANHERDRARDAKALDAGHRARRRAMHRSTTGDGVVDNQRARAREFEIMCILRTFIAADIVVNGWKRREKAA